VKIINFKTNELSAFIILVICNCFLESVYCSIQLLVCVSVKSQRKVLIFGLVCHSGRITSRLSGVRYLVEVLVNSEQNNIHMLSNSENSDYPE